jgi:hypothetical protein
VLLNFGLMSYSNSDRGLDALPRLFCLSGVGKGFTVIGLTLLLPQNEYQPPFFPSRVVREALPL